MARMPATPKQGIARSVLLRPTGQVRGNATQPAPARNAGAATVTQSPGGGQLPPGRAARPGRQRQRTSQGIEIYLWILVAGEVMLVGGLRQVFKRYHGG